MMFPCIIITWKGKVFIGLGGEKMLSRKNVGLDKYYDVRSCLCRNEVIVEMNCLGKKQVMGEISMKKSYEW